jgi:hypothetical protein
MTKPKTPSTALSLARSYLPVFLLMGVIALIIVVVEVRRVHADDVSRFKTACAGYGADVLTDVSIDRIFSLSPFASGLKDAQVVFFSGPAGDKNISFFLVEKADGSLVCGGRLGDMVAGHVLSGALRFEDRSLFLGQVIPAVGQSPVFVEVAGQSTQSGKSVSGSQFYSVYGREFMAEGLWPSGAYDQAVTKVCVIYQSKGFDAVGYGDTDCSKDVVAQIPFDIQKMAVDIH